MRIEGVGAVPTTLQVEMMPSGKKNRVLSWSKKIFGVLECGGSWTKCRLGHIGGVTVACKTYYVGLPIRSPDVDPVLQVEYKKIVSAAFA